MPVFLAFATLVLLTAFWPSPKSLAHLLALSAAVLIGIQFWYAARGGVYVLWYLPLLVLVVFRPNLADRRPPVVEGQPGRLRRAVEAFAQWATRRHRAPEAAGPRVAAA